MTPPPAPLARLDRLDRRRVWFGHLYFHQGPGGGTVELTGWRRWARLRRTFVLTSGTEVLWDPVSPEANLWLVVGDAPPVALHVSHPGLVQAALDRAFRHRGTPAAPPGRRPTA